MSSIARDRTVSTSKPIKTDIPARMDRLPWSRWHWLVVIALGITWILDLGITGYLFTLGILSAVTQTIAWVVIFFFASAGASSAYLTVSEIFPLEIRSMAIAFFYAVGTGVGGVIGPVLFGNLIETGHRQTVFYGYLIGAVVMIAAGVVEAFLGVNAERQSLENIANPLSAVEGEEAQTAEEQA